jgi:NAD(P)-dependent dehydrogenase (short-subunit alcohol dehydrogenase family)
MFFKKKKTLTLFQCHRAQIFIFNYFFRNYNKSRLNITTCIFSNWVGSSQFSIWRFFSRGGVLDVRDYDRYEEFSKKVKEIVKEDGLNILFNNAGVSSKFTRIQLVKSEQMLEAFKVNTIGPIMLTKALLPLLKQAANNSEGPLGAQKAVVINTTSVLGSIALNNDGGFFPYRCSKAALNMATKSLSVDLLKDQILVTCVHPGWVKTDMGGSNAPLDVDTSVTGIIELIRNLNETHNGGFYQFDGQRLDW